MRSLKINVTVRSHIIIILKNKLKSAEIWKGIRSLVNIKASTSSFIRMLNENDNLEMIFGSLTNVFNNYFFINWSSN